MTASLLTSTGRLSVVASTGVPGLPAAGDGSGGGGARVLVVFASRHGATREIAAVLARQLLGTGAGGRSGLSVQLIPVQQHPDPAAFDAVVLGSAVYDGRWLSPAVAYAEATAPALRARPTWLYSSGLADLAGGPPVDGDPMRLGASIGSRGHRFFPGRLEGRLLSAVERQLLIGRPAREGDCRDWAAVSQWAGGIASDLGATRSLPSRDDVA